MKNPYFIARNMYWKLPPSVRNFFRTPARNLAPILRAATRYGHSNRSADLSWRQFKSNILDHSAAYKGIFVQSVVIDWNVDLFQRPQHMAAAFARRGYLVIYQTDNWTKDDVVGFRQVAPNVWITNHNVMDFISNAVISLYSTAYSGPKIVVDKSQKYLQTVYEYIDHITPEISGSVSNLKILNELKDYAFSGGTDYIVASAGVLYDEAVAAVGKAKVMLVPNGVDTQHYRNPQSREIALPSALAEFRQKYKQIVGYFGALAPWLWYDEINKLIKNRPDIGFVFIGPDYLGGSKNLINAKNVFCTGAVDYKNLPAYAATFDICFIPFAPGEIARTTSPLKLFEYFALEKPVVVTAGMNECVQFPEVFVGVDADSLSIQIDKAFVVKDDAAFKARLGVLADENDWDHRAAAYEKVFSDLRREA